MQHPILFIYSFLFLSAVCFHAFAVEEDAVAVIWQTYLQNRKGLDDLDEWFDKIVEVIDSHPQSEAKLNVLINLSGSCNSAKKYDKSVKVLQRILTFEAPLYWRLEVIGCLGAVHKEMYQEAMHRQDVSTAKNNAEKVLLYYGQYSEELKKAEKQQLLGTGELAGLQRELVIHFCTEVELQKDVYGDTAASLKKAAEAIQFLQKNPHAGWIGYDEALFQQKKAKILLESEQRESAEAAMIDYGFAGVSRDTIKSLQAREFAAATYPKKGKGYRDFLQRWLDKVPQDAETVLVLRDIGRSFFDDGMYDEAIDVFENIRQHWWEKILSLDTIPLKNQMGGYSANVLTLLCQSYQKTLQVEKAEQCLEELRRLVPRDAMIPALESWQERSVLDAETQQIVKEAEEQTDKRNMNRRLTIVAVNGILILLFLYLFWRKKS